jgi:hypothetical protein
VRPQPRRRPTHRVGRALHPRLDLIGIPLDQVVTGNHGRTAFRPPVESLGYPLRAITPALTRFGRVYVIQVDANLHTVDLAARAGGTITVPLPAERLQRQAATVLAGVTADWPPSSMTATLARTLAAVVDLCDVHRLRGSRTIPRHDLQETLATPLASFAAAWSGTPSDQSADPEETPAERSPEQ